MECGLKAVRQRGIFFGKERFPKTTFDWLPIGMKMSGQEDEDPAFGIHVNKLGPTTARRIKSTPDLVRKEALAAVVVFAVVCLVSGVWDAPLEGPADPMGIPAENVKAPWIFLGIQQLLRYLPAWLAGVVVPVAALAAFGFVPYLWRIRGKSAATCVCGIVLVFLALTVWGYLR